MAVRSHARMVCLGAIKHHPARQPVPLRDTGTQHPLGKGRSLSVCIAARSKNETKRRMLGRDLLPAVVR
jgi:hypothetical protein